MIDGVENKQCSICEEWFPCNSEYFYKNKSSRSDGLSPYCKKCTINKTMTERDVNRVNELSKHYYRTREKTRENRRNNMRKRREEGKYKEWQQKNPDKIRGYNKKREIHKKHEISKEEWENCKNYFNYRCAYCELAVEEHFKMWNGKPKQIDLHKEHVDHNGSNDLSNCIPSCQRCNSSKWENNLEEWYTSKNPDFTQERLNKIYKWLEEDYKKFKE